MVCWYTYFYIYKTSNLSTRSCFIHLITVYTQYFAPCTHSFLIRQSLFTCALLPLSQVHLRWSVTTMTQPRLFTTSPTAATHPRLQRWAQTPWSSAWPRSQSSRTPSTSGAATASNQTRVSFVMLCFIDSAPCLIGRTLGSFGVRTWRPVALRGYCTGR